MTCVLHYKYKISVLNSAKSVFKPHLAGLIYKIEMIITDRKFTVLIKITSL